MFNKLKKKARQASALVRGSSTSYTPSSGKKGKDPASPVHPAHPSAFAYTPVHLEFLDFSPGGAKYASVDKKKSTGQATRNSPGTYKQKSASLPRESYLTKHEDDEDNASVTSYHSNNSDRSNVNQGMSTFQHSSTILRGSNGWPCLASCGTLWFICGSLVQTLY